MPYIPPGVCLLLRTFFLSRMLTIRVVDHEGKAGIHGA